MAGSSFPFGSDVACTSEAQLSDHATISCSASGHNNVTSGPMCTEADAGAGKDVIVASMHALGWPVASPRDAPAAIEAAVSAAEAAIAAVTAAANLHSMESGRSGGQTDADEVGSLPQSIRPPQGTAKAPAKGHESSVEQPQWTVRAAAPWGHTSQTLPPIAEDSPLGEQSAQTFMDAPHGQGSALATNSVVPLPASGPDSIGVDMVPGNVQVDAWIHGWAAQVSELLGYFSREIARLVERMDQVDQKIASTIEKKCLAASEAKSEDAGRSSDEKCNELAETFTEALKMEREARMYETAQLRAALNAAGPSHVQNANSAARLAENLAHAASSECDRFSKIAGKEWTQFSEGAASLRTRLSSELTEQHAWAILDLKEQHSAATRALFAEHDARVCEARDFHARLHKEVTEIASEAAEEILEQQDRERQCAELRVALQQAAQDGVILPSSHSNHSSAIGDSRRRGLSGSSRSTLGQGEPPRKHTEEVAVPQATPKTDAIPRRGTSDATRVENCGRSLTAEVPETQTDSRPVDRLIVVPSTIQGDIACGSSISRASAASAASPSTTFVTQVFQSSPATVSMALRAEAAVRGDLGVAAQAARAGRLGSSSMGASLQVARGDAGTSLDQEHLGFGSSICSMQDMQGQRGLSQDFPIDHFGSFCNFAPERRSAGGTRGVSPERKSPTRGSRMFPPPSMVLPPPSQVMPSNSPL